MGHNVCSVNRKDRVMTNDLIEEIFEADAAGWTVSEIANEFKITKQAVVALFLEYERYEPTDPELNT